MAKQKQRKDKDTGENNSENAEAHAATKMRRKEFEKALYALQVELTRLQAWTVATAPARAPSSSSRAAIPPARAA
jgi:polyphosphate kinase 2 (PPK2 family)